MGGGGGRPKPTPQKKKNHFYRKSFFSQKLIYYAYFSKYVGVRTGASSAHRKKYMREVPLSMRFLFFAEVVQERKKT